MDAADLQIVYGLLDGKPQVVDHLGFNWTLLWVILLMGGLLLIWWICRTMKGRLDQDIDLTNPILTRPGEDLIKKVREARDD